METESHLNSGQVDRDPTKTVNDTDMENPSSANEMNFNQGPVEMENRPVSQEKDKSPEISSGIRKLSQTQRKRN